MLAAPASPLAAWESFYVVMGTAAAALTGLQFVVIAFVGQAGVQVSEESVAAFGTPTIVHFSAVLLLSALLTAPWTSAVPAALVIGACGIVGLAYTAFVVRRARRQAMYEPVAEDWLWHAVLPLLAYATLVGAATFGRARVAPALFAVAAAALVLLFIGIHNAWDTVTWVAVQQRQHDGAPGPGAERSAARPGREKRRRQARR